MAIINDFIFTGPGDESRISGLMAAANARGERPVLVYLDDINEELRKDRPEELIRQVARACKEDFDYTKAATSATDRGMTIEEKAYIGTHREVDGVNIDTMADPDILPFARQRGFNIERYVFSHNLTKGDLVSRVSKFTLAEIEESMRLAKIEHPKFKRKYEANIFVSGLYRDQLALMADSMFPVDEGEMLRDARSFLDFISEDVADYETNIAEDFPVWLGDLFNGVSLAALQEADNEYMLFKAIWALVASGRMSQNVTKRGAGYKSPDARMPLPAADLDGGEIETDPDQQFSREEIIVGRGADGRGPEALIRIAIQYWNQETDRPYLDQFWDSVEETWYELDGELWYDFVYEYYSNYGEGA